MLKIDEIEEFAKRDKITTSDDFNVSHAPSGCNCHKTNGYKIFYEIVYDEESGFPRVEKSKNIHKILSVHFQFRGNDVPLPQMVN